MFLNKQTVKVGAVYVFKNFDNTTIGLVLEAKFFTRKATTQYKRKVVILTIFSLDGHLGSQEFPTNVEYSIEPLIT